MSVLAGITCVSIALVLYHHLFYPVILEGLARRRPPALPLTPSRGYSAREAFDAELPTVTFVIPAFNERAVIADKIRNLAALDYPADRFRVLIVCDGCTDDTAAVARAAAAEIECRHLHLEIRELAANRGKLAILNHVLPTVDDEVIALSDASALTSIDALLLAADHFADPRTGVVCGTYRLLRPGNAGEAVYWAQQVRIKEREAAIGAPQGAHGAFYLFRRELFRPMPTDTINDDFVLPMSIIAAGHRGTYDRRIVAVELEQTTAAQEWRRRRRIAAGNLQQLVRLRRLLHPRYRGIAFAFASGKALRTIMPFLMIQAFVGSILLAPTHVAFALAAGVQALLYATALLPMLFPARAWPAPVASITYLVRGHLCGLLGATRYLLTQRRHGWSGTADDTTRGAAAIAPADHGDAAPVCGHAHPAVRRFKRLLDVAAALVLLIPALPLFLLIAVAVRLDSRGPVFFRQLRIGESTPDYVRLFHIIKFRTMREDAEAVTGAVWASAADPRITRVGAVLRRTRLDELPQLINVLRGEMSLVGPRPERPCFFGRLDNDIPFYGERIYGAPPGITGFAQVNQNADLTLDDVRVKLYFDHAYALALSRPRAWLTLDLQIALRTIVLMLRGPGMLDRQVKCLPFR